MSQQFATRILTSVQYNCVSNTATANSTQRGQRPPTLGRSVAAGPVSSSSSVGGPDLRAPTGGRTGLPSQPAQQNLVGATLASQGGPVAAVATIGGAARRQSRKYLFTCRLRKFRASRRQYQLSVRLCYKKQHISTLRLEFSILSNKNAPAAPHIPSAVSAHRRWDAPSRQDRSRAALRLERQPSARPREDGAGCRRRQHSAGASRSHSWFHRGDQWLQWPPLAVLLGAKVGNI